MTSIIITVLFVLYKIPLINMIGDKGMGYFSIAFVIYLLFMTFNTYGIPKALSNILIQQRTKEQYTSLNHTIKAAFVFSGSIGLIITLIMFFCAEFIATEVLKASNCVYAIRGISFCILPMSMLSVIHGVFSGLKLITISKKIRNLEKFLISILTLVGGYWFSRIDLNDSNLLTAYSSMGAVLGISISIYIAFVYSYIFYNAYLKKLKRFIRKDKTKITQSYFLSYKMILIYALPYVLTLLIFHVSNLMDYAVFNRIMSVQGHKESNYIILLGMLNGKYEFFISFPILVISWYLITKIPDFKQSVEENNKRKLYSKISQTIRFLMLFIIPCTAIYIVFSTPLLDLVFNGMNDTPSVLLKTGAISIVFYTLAVISNTILDVLDDWKAVAKNAFISLVVQFIALIVMLIVFKWNIIAVVLSRIIFSISLCVFNEHRLREITGYILEYKKSFFIPVIASCIMSFNGFVLYFIFKLVIQGEFAFLIAILISIPVYILALVFLGGITQREMYRLPGGKILAPLCRKLHLIK